MFNGWKLTKDGWVKIKRGKGNADYFARELPPVRDVLNRPLKEDGTIDNKRLIEEVNSGKWKKP